MFQGKWPDSEIPKVNIRSVQVKIFFFQTFKQDAQLYEKIFTWAVFDIKDFKINFGNKCVFLMESPFPRLLLSRWCQNFVCDDFPPNLIVVIIGWHQLPSLCCLKRFNQYSRFRPNYGVSTFQYLIMLRNRSSLLPHRCARASSTMLAP